MEYLEEFSHRLGHDDVSIEDMKDVLLKCFGTRSIKQEGNAQYNFLYCLFTQGGRFFLLLFFFYILESLH